MKKEAIIYNVEKNKDLMLTSERWLWSHPQTGFNEWQAHTYLKEQFEKLGYQVVQAGIFRGFMPTPIQEGKVLYCVLSVSLMRLI